MSAQNEAFAKGVEIIVETIMFENWLRFYFINEKLGKEGEQSVLSIAIPEQGMKKIEEMYPHLLPLAQNLNGKTIDFETSRSAVCTFVMTEVDGKTIPRNMADMVFDSSTFQIELQLFNTWVQAHEDQLDQNFMDFAMWRSLFAAWRKTEAVQEWATKLRAAAVQGMDSQAADTVQ